MDNPNVRASDTCPVCNHHKDEGLVTCWPCYRAGAKYGEYDDIIEAAEAQIEYECARLGFLQLQKRHTH